MKARIDKRGTVTWGLSDILHPLPCASPPDAPGATALTPHHQLGDALGGLAVALPAHAAADRDDRIRGGAVMPRGVDIDIKQLDRAPGLTQFPHERRLVPALD